MGQVGGADRDLGQAVDRLQGRSPSRVVQQSSEIAVERIEAGGLRGEGGTQARLAVGVIPDLGRGPRSGRRTAPRSTTSATDLSNALKLKRSCG